MRSVGVILAGGQGLRMGGADKALVTLAGHSLIARVAARLEPQVERLAVSGRQGYLGLPVLPDAPENGPSRGPLAGVLAGLRWADRIGVDAVVTVPVDGPFLPCDLVPRLWLAGEGRLTLAQSGPGAGTGAGTGADARVHPTFGLWPVGLAGELQAFLDSGAKARVLDFAMAQGAVMAGFAEDGSFDNLNTPEDLARAEARLRSGSEGVA